MPGDARRLRSTRAPGTSRRSRRGSRSKCGSHERSTSAAPPVAAGRRARSSRARRTGRPAASSSHASSDSRLRPLTMWTSVSGSEASPRAAADLGVGAASPGCVDELAQRAVVVEQEGAAAGAAELRAMRGLPGLVECGRRKAASRLGAKRSSRSRNARAQRRCRAAPRGRSSGSSRRRRSRVVEVERLEEPAGEVAGVPGIHEERAREHLRGAGELAQEQRPVPAAPAGSGAAWQSTNSCATRFIPSRSGVDHHHVGAPVEGDELRSGIDRCRYSTGSSRAGRSGR